MWKACKENSREGELDGSAKARLALAAQSGDLRAFERLAKHVSPKIRQRASLRLALVSQADLEEIVQETLIIAFEKLSQLRDAERFEAWVGRIADNQARKWHRKRARQLELFAADGGAHELHAQPDDASQRIHPVTMKAHVRAAVRTLSHEHQAVIQCHYFLRHSYKETAERLSLDVNLVRSRLQKARKQLRKTLRTMNEDKMKAEVILLSGGDVDMLRRANSFCSRDEKRHALHGMLLSPKGRLVATDGKRLLCRQSERFRRLKEPIVLKSRFAAENEGDSDETAELVLGLNDAVVRTRNRKDLLFDISNTAYPDYEKAFPSSFQTEGRVAGSDWAAALREIDAYLHAKHPAVAGWEYKPQIRLRSDAMANRLSISTDSRMGYSEIEDADPEEFDSLNWHYAVSIAWKSETGGRGLSFAMNRQFLVEATENLQIADSDEVVLKWNQDDLILELRNRRFSEDFALIKPISET